jgi:hypothetical protein
MSEVKRLKMQVRGRDSEMETAVRMELSTAILEFARNTEHGPDDYLTIEVEYVDKQGVVIEANPVILKHADAQGNLRLVREAP